MLDFTGQVVVVTGGSSGIGLASAAAFLSQGAARVYVTGRTEKTLAQAVETLGPKAVAVVADVAKPGDLEALSAKISESGDRLDVVFANAGIAEKNAFGQTDVNEYARTFDINVRGLFFTVQTLLPLLRDGGSVVLNASIVANKGMADLSLYNASKAAVRSFARTFANDLKGRGIRVNAVSPGATRTPIMENGLGLNAEAIDQFSAYLKDAAPAGRMGRPEEIAAAVLFLASRDASYVNGVELAVDGGFAQV